MKKPPGTTHLTRCSGEPLARISPLPFLTFFQALVAACTRRRKRRMHRSTAAHIA